MGQRGPTSDRSAVFGHSYDHDTRSFNDHVITRAIDFTTGSNAEAKPSRASRWTSYGTARQAASPTR